MPLRAQPSGDEPGAVDDGRHDDDTREPDPVADPSRDQRRDDVPAGDRREDRRRRRERLVEADRDIEHDERARACEGPLPRRVRDEECRDVPVLAEDAPRLGDVRADAFEDASVAAVLGDEQDRHEARARDHAGCDEERRRVPGVKEVPAPDQRTADRDPSENVLDALRTAEHALGQHVRVEPAIRRLVDVVGEEERAQHQRGRPEVRHERQQREGERHRAHRDEHERAAAAERRVERIAPRADHERERQGEDAFRRQDEPDERRRLRVLAEDRREVRGGGGQRPRETERARPEGERRAAGPAVRRRRGSRRARRGRRRRSCARHGRPPRRRREACPTPSP